jgi:hypothetical protein
VEVRRSRRNDPLQVKVEASFQVPRAQGLTVTVRLRFIRINPGLRAPVTTLRSSRGTGRVVAEWAWIPTSRAAATVALVLVSRPQEHVQRSTNGGANGRRRLHFLLSKFSSFDLRSTVVTLFN